MTRLDHNRAELRRVDNLARRNKQERAKREPREKAVHDRSGFLDEQDAMGSALSVLHNCRPVFVFALARTLEHAFLHNDLNVIMKLVNATTDPNERSIFLRIAGGLFSSHRFEVCREGIKLVRHDRLTWRGLGLWALRSNLSSYRTPDLRKFRFSEEFEAKYARFIYADTDFKT